MQSTTEQSVKRACRCRRLEILLWSQRLCFHKNDHFVHSSDEFELIDIGFLGGKALVLGNFWKNSVDQSTLRSVSAVSRDCGMRWSEAERCHDQLEWR